MCEVTEVRRLAHYQAQARIAELQEQRDELAEALRGMLDYEIKQYALAGSRDRVPPEIAAARAAVAKVQS